MRVSGQVPHARVWSGAACACLVRCRMRVSGQVPHARVWSGAACACLAERKLQQLSGQLQTIFNSESEITS